MSAPGFDRKLRHVWPSSLFVVVAAAQLLFLCAGRRLAAHDPEAALLAAAGIVLVVAAAGLDRLKPWALALATAGTAAVALGAREGWLELPALAVQAFSIMAAAQAALACAACVSALRGAAAVRRELRARAAGT